MIAALIIAALFFCVIQFLGNMAVESFFSGISYVQRENNRRVKQLQDFVREKKISLTEIDRIADWVKKQNIITIQIYKDGMLVYDFNYPYENAPEYNISSKYHDSELYHLIEFSDQTAYVFLNGYYSYQFYNYVIIAGILFSVILFFCIVMAEVRKIIEYIYQLNEEIQILESGILEYEVTEMGNDELACLARGLNSMRKSLNEQMKQKEKLVQMNNQIITDLSHEIRTPLTSLIIYTEIFRSNKTADWKMALYYIDRIADRAKRIQHLADRIVKYSTDNELEYPFWEDEILHGNHDE